MSGLWAGTSEAGQLVGVDVVGAALGQDRQRPALMVGVAQSDPEQQPAVVELVAQPLRLVAAEQARGPGADQAAAAAGADRRDDGRSQRPARGDHRPGRDRGADVGETADHPDPADRERVVTDEGRARHGRVVLQLLHLLIGVAQLLLDRLRAGQKTELRAIEARVQQILDRILQGIAVMEDPDRLADPMGHFGRVHRRPPASVRRQDTSAEPTAGALAHHDHAP